LIILGELKRRIKLNRKRLSTLEYKSPLIFEQGGEWPGDWQGRTLLALVNHYELAESKREKNNIKKQMDDILKQVHIHLNEDGYFGDKLDLTHVNEQQISGNSWFLRGLAEHYKMFKDTVSVELMKTITETYLLKLIEPYRTYPQIKREDGGVGGHLLKKTYNQWQLSSDVGCAFIMLDGCTQVYELIKDERLIQLIDVMIERFLSIDLIGNNCQTHATLSATRGLMRYYLSNQNEKLLDDIIRIYQLYLDEGMTINYANINWFGKKSWTEPCAVVDSFILAKQLYEVTQEYKYVQLMNAIYYNAILTGQRKNGGAGCETCLLHHEDEFKIHTYEAYFCCTMRLAEGLKEACKALIMNKKDEMVISNLNDFENYESNGVVISFTSNKSDISTLQIHIDNKENSKGFLKIYLPEHAQIIYSSCQYEYQNYVIIPLSISTLEIKYRSDVMIKTIKGESVHIQGDRILLKNNDKKEYGHMTDYTHMKKHQALKDRQKL
jgi:uncharacterized protein